MGAFCSDCFKAPDSRGSYNEIPDKFAADNTVNSRSADAATYQQVQSDLGAKKNDTSTSPTAPVSIPLPMGNPSNNIVNKSTAPQPGFFLKYDLKEVLGVGSTASCHRCCRKSDNANFACKVIDKRQIEAKFTGLLEQFYVEIRVLQELSHPNIISLEGVFETSDRIFIVMELMTGGELFDYVVDKGTLNELEASVIVRKITAAIAHMHSKHIIHRDLKPENLLLTSRDPNCEVKIIDFGLAKVLANEPVAHSFLGTRGYLAPEMLQRHTYDMAIDIWALGVIVFVLLCGCLPFDDDSSKISSDADAKKKFTLRFPKWASNLSLPAKDLLQNLLDVNPKTRFTADQALHHPWVTGKAVSASNYLQSPNMLGKRNKKEPMTPHMQAMHNRLMAANNSNASLNPPPPANGYTSNVAAGALPRKNSF